MPKFERQEDLETEQAIFDEIQTAWKCFVVKNKEEYARFDGYVYNSEKTIRAILEVKNRPTLHWFDVFKHYEISNKKVNGCLEIAEKLGVPAILAVNFSGEILWVKLKKGYDTKIGGRTRTTRDNAPNDIEEMALIPIDDFKDLVVQ